MKKIKVLSRHDRTRIINKVSILDTVTNLFLGLIKLVIAYLSGSVTIASDAVLNLGDFVSGIVTTVGIKLSEHKPTQKHPFGFGRIEYLTTILVSVIMIIIGGEFGRIAISHIQNPVDIHVTDLQFGILFIIVAVKFGLCYYNFKSGEKTENETLDGIARDAFISACGTGLMVSLIFLDRFIKVNLDGWVSLGVAVFIIVSGIFDILKTINLMLGTKPNEELLKEIKETALSISPIEDVKNIIIHSYGYFVHYGQMDVELPDDMDIKTASTVLEDLKTVLEEKYEIEFTFGLWPENLSYKNTIHQFRKIDKGVTISKSIQPNLSKKIPLSHNV